MNSFNTPRTYTIFTHPPVNFSIVTEFNFHLSLVAPVRAFSWQKAIKRTQRVSSGQQQRCWLKIKKIIQKFTRQSLSLILKYSKWTRCNLLIWENHCDKKSWSRDKKLWDFYFSFIIRFNKNWVLVWCQFSIIRPTKLKCWTIQKFSHDSLIRII